MRQQWDSADILPMAELLPGVDIDSALATIAVATTTMRLSLPAHNIILHHNIIDRNHRSTGNNNRVIVWDSFR